MYNCNMKAYLCLLLAVISVGVVIPVPTDDTCPCATGLDMTRTGVKAIGRKVYLYVYPTIGSCIGSSDVDYR